MSTSKRPAVRSGNGKAGTASPAPLLGALLRIAHEEMTQGMLAHLQARGIELSVTEYRVLRYPGPDGVRPVDLAQRCNLTRQAMNYVLAGLERKGLIERRAPPGRATRLIYATTKGWAMFMAMREAVEAVEADWVGRIGAAQVDALRGILFDLGSRLGKIDPASAKPAGPIRKPRRT